MLAATWEILLELSPWLLLGTAVAGLVHVLLPGDLIRSQLTGRWAALKAVLIGVPMPLCSCGVIPAGLGLKKDGATDGAAVGFLIATPQTGLDSIFVSASFLGWPFALFKVLSAGVTGVVGGLLTDRFGGRAAEADLGAGQVEGEHGGSRWQRAWDHGIDLLRSIWRWLVFGVVVSALIDVFVPPQSLTTLGELGIVGAAFATLLVSLPLYVCATASVPIAASLVAAGMPTGAALVFLMAGPASNVATVGAVYRGFGWRNLAIYLATIVAGSVGFGILFDFVLESGGSAAIQDHEHATWWAIASSIALLLLLARFAWEDAASFLRRRRLSADSGGDLHELQVDGMTCGNCVSHVERALLATEGVTGASVVLETGRAVVRGSVSDDRLLEAVRSAGYAATPAALSR